MARNMDASKELNTPTNAKDQQSNSDKQATTSGQDEKKKDADTTPEVPPRVQSKPRRTQETDAAESHPREPADGPIREGASQPLETVLQMEPPTTTGSEEHKHPHLHAPPYVHHFDTFTLVNDLEKGGFTLDQSVTLMKAVRSLLAINMELARDGLVSKSDVENVCVSGVFPSLVCSKC